MLAKRTIKPNNKLYDGIELIPLNVEAVNQRIDYFQGKLEDEIINGCNNANVNKWNKALSHWKGIKEWHCEED